MMFRFRRVLKQRFKKTIEIQYFRESEVEEAFQWMRKPIGAKSPECNPVYYFAQLFIPHSINGQFLFGDAGAYV